MKWFKWLAIGIATLGIAYGTAKLDFSRTNNGWNIYSKNNPNHTINYDRNNKEVKYNYHSSDYKSVDVRYKVKDATLDTIIKKTPARYAHMSCDIKKHDASLSGFYKNRYYNAHVGIKEPYLYRFYTKIF